MIELALLLLMAALPHGQFQTKGSVTSIGSIKTVFGTGTAVFDYYASPTGSDSNPCSLAQPCASWNGLRAAMSGQTGKKACFETGLYTLQHVVFSNSDSGNTYTNCTGASPQLTTGVLLGGWSLAGSGGCANGSTISGCYKTTVSSTVPFFENLWYKPNGGNWFRRLRARAVTENNIICGGQCPFLYMWGPADGTFPSATVIKYRPGDVRSSYYHANDVEVLFHPSWRWQRQRISSINTGSNYINLSCTGTGCVGCTNPGTTCGKQAGPEPGEPYLIENSREDFVANAAVGTWYMDCTGGVTTGCVNDAAHTDTWTLYYIVNPGEDPTNGLDQVLVPGGTVSSPIKQMVQSSGLPASITISNLELGPGVDNFTIPANGFNAVNEQTNVPAAIDFVDASNYLFTGNTVHGSSGQLLDIASSGNALSSPSGVTIQTDVFYDSGNVGISIRDVTSRNNGSPASGDNLNNTVSGWTITDSLFTGMQRFMPGGGGACVVGAQGYNGSVSYIECDHTYNGGVNFGTDVSSTHSSCDSGGSVCMKNIVVANVLGQFLGQGVGYDFGLLRFGTLNNTGNSGQGNRGHDIVSDFTSMNFSGDFIAAATFTSTSGTITGTTSQTCKVTFPASTGTQATATVVLTGTNTIAGGTALTITIGGTLYTTAIVPPAATNVTLSNGTATCSGTAVVKPALLGYFEGFSNGLYTDQNSQNVTWTNNLIYNTTGPLYFNNGSQTGQCSQPSGGGFPGCNNVASNNIFAFSQDSCYGRWFAQPSGSNTFQNFTAQHNICELDLSGAHAMKAGAAMNCGQSGNLPPCTQYWNLVSNDYYSIARTLNGANNDWYTQNSSFGWNLSNTGSATCTSGATHNFWDAPPTGGSPTNQCPGEDVGSFQESVNPFVTAHNLASEVIANNFTLTGSQHNVGYVPCSAGFGCWTSAGTQTVLTAPTVPDTMPTQNPGSF